ncbi:sugar transferase [Scytonema hofmannii FACHB-248]|uniref:Sugar transferase n=1 Tax=Scytonema hofmannii FACHB-248 TaxID=1842502 RepID=A0ABR8GUU5_9CYAN|nr:MULTISPECIES: sugar transferase [Nostocales]MBD2606849.1 sugar transferase [Scytonema hofmannii FACHB-248]
MYQTSLKTVLQGATSQSWELELTPHPSVQSKLKRCLDILGSLIGLLILAIAFVPIALAIKIDNPGPIFFAQERYGLQGCRFRMRKFRSMVVDAEKLKSLVDNEANGLLFKNKNDFRITKVGRFLRSTSLDELPQFWNVLVGEMSLVGTRPPTADEVAYYNQRHWQRLNVKPGMTGEWQVNGRSSVKNFEQVVDLDLRYQENWHPLYDLQLILKTIYVIFAKVGAF